MKNLVRRIAVFTAVTLLSLLALPQPAQACYACELTPICADFSFGGYWCGYVSVCRDQGFPCSICYPGCIEGFDTCSNIGPACQFASNLSEPRPDRLVGATTFAFPVAR